MTLAPAEIARRARRLKLVLTDCDGVLTDAGVYYSAQGEELKRFSVRDGMGVERLRNAGVESAIVTGERSLAVQKRAEKLAVEAHLFVKDKAAKLSEILARHELVAGEVGYIGDDVNDLGVIARVAAEGLVAAPVDAMAEVRRAVHLVTEARGGQGAFREFAEWILAARRT